MFSTFDGLSATNPYLPSTSHLRLSHANLADILLLADYDEQPYERYGTGLRQADGRNLIGSIRTKNGNWRKELWECNFLVLPTQVALFEQLLTAQQAEAVQLVDNWDVDGVPISKNVWLNCDAKYVSQVGVWRRLQFQVWEV